MYIEGKRRANYRALDHIHIQITMNCKVLIIKNLDLHVNIQSISMLKFKCQNQSISCTQALWKIVPKATDNWRKSNPREKPWHLDETRTLRWVGQGLFLLSSFSSKWKKTFLKKLSVSIYFYTLLLDDNGCCSLHFQTKPSVFVVQNYLKVIEKKERKKRKWKLPKSKINYTKFHWP